MSKVVSDDLIRATIQVLTSIRSSDASFNDIRGVIAALQSCPTINLGGTPTGTTPAASAEGKPTPAQATGKPSALPSRPKKVSK